MLVVTDNITGKIKERLVVTDNITGKIKGKMSKLQIYGN
jgi:uncharacterized protein YjbJ (UPF0337 family)